MPGPKDKNDRPTIPRRADLSTTQPLATLGGEDDDEQELTIRQPLVAPPRPRTATSPFGGAAAPQPTPPRKPTSSAQPASAPDAASAPARRKPTAPPVPAAPPPAALGDDEEDDAPTMVVDMLASHYTGPKSGLKPVFDAVIDAAKRLGGVKVVPGPVYVTLVRTREFALLMPTPQGDRVELGLVLPAQPPTRRLMRARHFNWGERYSHYVTLRYKTDVDAEVRAWLTEACWKGG